MIMPADDVGCIHSEITLIDFDFKDTAKFYCLDCHQYIEHKLDEEDYEELS